MTSITTIEEKNIKEFQGILPETETGDSCFRFGIIVDGTPAAAVELNNADGICEINSIFVVPEKRRRDLGRTCLAAAEELARQNGMWALKASYCTDSVMSDFFSRCGFIIEEGDTMYEISKNDIVSSRFFSKLSGKGNKDNVKSLSELDKKKSRSLDEFLKDNGYESYISKVPYCEQDISKVHISDDGRVDACLLADDQLTDIFVTLLLNASGRESVLLDLISGAKDKIIEKSYSFENLRFFAEDERIPALMRTAIGDDGLIRESVLTQSAVKRIV